MDHATSTRTTAERAGVPEETAERIEHATPRTLADRISGGEAQDVAAQLPTPLRGDLRPPREEAEAFRGGRVPAPDRGTRGRRPGRGTGAAAVLTTVREALRPGEFDDVLSQLPQEYRELVGPMA
ncbi:DUF2267 domain-containing protein [Geodermatophilus sp. SYSU D01036]